MTHNSKYEGIFLEAIQTEEGHFLVRAGNSKEPLFVLAFRDDAEHLLRGNQNKIAEAMIEAGIQVAGKVIEQSVVDFASQTLH